MKLVYDAIKQALVERGWKIDESATETPSGELHEFVHPVTERRRAYIDAILDQGVLDFELDAGNLSPEEYRKALETKRASR